MKKYKLIILFFIITSFNIYAFSFNELTAKLDVDRANRLMKKGNYEGAITLYEKALSKVPNSPEIFYNMGTTMSSIGDIESAVQLFDMAKKSVTENTSKKTRSAIHYNAGITKIEGQDYQGAIDELVESLVNTPDDENAKRALEYAQKKLEEQKKNQQNNSGFNNQQSEDNQDGQSDNNGNSDENNQNNNDNNNQNQDNQNQDNQDNQDNQNQDNQNNNGNNDNQDNQNNNNQNNNDQNNNDNEDSKSDIDRLLESLRQFRKDKDNGDQYYGGGRIDKDW
ncbi:tetratricopeptide repeat protein [uncultured Brachyspira sp.]|uniref:tetratricopeptide repeat protein n=1 Tax=uncultured Brachyspira sp. TaxID=221953 RepID=UPI00261AA6AD|nr:tetratricopeptide repeat protein [uncultured Brachyspira sp.]